MSAPDNFAHAVATAQHGYAYAQKLRDIGATCGYLLDYRAMRATRKNGFPMRSSKPWHILYSDGTLCASFATFRAFERNLRGRCGC